MSIGVEIGHRISEGRLFPLIPKAAGSSPRRAMFVSEEVWNLLSVTHDDEEMEDRLGKLQADLEQFAEGQPVDPTYLKLLAPARDAVWEIRSVRPAPSVRVLGRFAMYDVFIATNYALRKPLGGWESNEWKAAKRAALACWNRLFGTYPPLRSTEIGDLISGAHNGKYYKD